MLNESEILALNERIVLFTQSVSEDDDFYMNLASDIAATSAKGNLFLIENLITFDGIRARAAIFALIENYDNKKALRKFLLKLIDDPRELVVSEVIDSLSVAGNSNDWSIIDKLVFHESPYVRGARLRFAAKKLDRELAFQILINALNDAHFIVIENAIDELEDIGLRKAIPFITKFLGYKHKHVRQAAESAIRCLENIDFVERG